ncbi:MAG: sulfur carrier protein ThiS adenylyltransferase ThiF [Bacteroidia bacterium]|nr:sulfur carrier protein ThiS adenylyltransferase ThiF [Bacteroidia bacterium]
MTFHEIKEILSKKTVGIAGCGGLGSNAAVALARVGIGKLIIADFDVIIEGNLNRQYFFYNQIGEKKCLALTENINKINPACIVESHDLKLNEENIPEIFRNCDLIIEAFDLAEMKRMLIETALEYFPNTPLIVASGLAGWGNFEDIKIKHNGNIFICGDNVNEVSEQNPPLAPRVGIVANMQANKALEILLS